LSQSKKLVLVRRIARVGRFFAVLVVAVEFSIDTEHILKQFVISSGLETTPILWTISQDISVLEFIKASQYCPN
jgi:hypothetical protein